MVLCEHKPDRNKTFRKSTEPGTAFDLELSNQVLIPGTLFWILFSDAKVCKVVRKILGYESLKKSKAVRKKG